MILSRELSLDEIEEIRQQCPDMELEVFVHGALCIAYSGRCLLSGYFNHRDANQGTCTNSCRWDYKVDSAAEDGTGDIQKIDFDFDKALSESPLSDCGSQPRHPLADKVYVISRKDHPGELMPVLEDEHGTYIMNSKDLRAVEHVERLAKIGIDSLKVEGRTKSIYYVARTAQAYRQAIDDARAGRAFDARLLGDLEALAQRGYTSGFLHRHAADSTQNYTQGSSQTGTHQYVGQVLRIDAGWAVVDVKNRFACGDQLDIIHPQGNTSMTLQHLTDLDGRELTVAPGHGHHVRFALDARFQGALIARRLPA